MGQAAGPGLLHRRRAARAGGGHLTQTTVHLVRHGAHALLPHTLAGRMDVGLSAEGEGEAARLAGWFGPRPVAALVSSPVRRARDTAAPVAARLGLPVAVDEAWTELDFGIWTGRGFAELDGDPAWHRWNACRGLACPPEGEAMHTAQSRALAGLERLRTAWQGRSVAVFSHADVIRAVLAAVLGVGLERPWRLLVGTGSVSTVAFGADGEAVVAGVNVLPGA